MRPIVHLYPEPAYPELDLEELAGYLKGLIPITVELRKAFFSYFPMTAEEMEALALGFAQAKIRNPLSQQEPPPLPGEIDYERRRLSSPTPPFGLIYQGERVMALFRDRIPREERNLGHLHIVFTNQLLATWEGGRYHLRVAIFGYPCLISTSGLVEAPARPREFYLLKQQYTSLGMADANVLRLEREFQDRMLSHHDPRIIEAMRGYLMQALFYHLSGDPFCPDPRCRLFNAHWQEEVIEAQLKSGEFCPQHRQKIEEWKHGKGELADAVAGKKAPPT